MKSTTLTEQLHSIFVAKCFKAIEKKNGLYDCCANISSHLAHLLSKHGFYFCFTHQQVRNLRTRLLALADTCVSLAWPTEQLTCNSLVEALS